MGMCWKALRSLESNQLCQPSHWLSIIAQFPSTDLNMTPNTISSIAPKGRYLALRIKQRRDGSLSHTRGIAVNALCESAASAQPSHDVRSTLEQAINPSFEQGAERANGQSLGGIFTSGTVGKSKASMVRPKFSMA